MACCGANKTETTRVTNEARAGWVLVAPAWGGMRNYWGLATRAFYGRVGSGVHLWADPRDVAADPLLRPVEPPPAPEAQQALTAEAEAEPTKGKRK